MKPWFYFILACISGVAAGVVADVYPQHTHILAALIVVSVMNVFVPILKLLYDD